MADKKTKATQEEQKTVKTGKDKKKNEISDKNLDKISGGTVRKDWIDI